MSHALHFYDSTEPRNVPSGSLVAYYAEGTFQWPEAELKRMRGVFGIYTHNDVSNAHIARCLDVETGAATIDTIVPFIKAREKAGHHDAIVYVNRSNLVAARNAVAFAKRHGEISTDVLWWVSTLDGTMKVGDEWATQYYGGMNTPFDKSIVHGEDVFRKP